MDLVNYQPIIVLYTIYWESNFGFSVTNEAGSSCLTTWNFFFAVANKSQT